MKTLWFVVLVCLHVIFSHAAHDFCLELARRAPEDRPPVLEALAGSALEFAWQPLLAPARNGTWPAIRGFFESHHTLGIWLNSTAAVGLLFLACGLAVWTFRLWRRFSQRP